MAKRKMTKKSPGKNLTKARSGLKKRKMKPTTSGPIRSAGEANEAVLSVSKVTTDGIFIISSGLFDEPCKKIIGITMQKRLPLTGCGAIELGGALLSYETDPYRNGNRGAWYVDRILKGTRPQDLPVEAPTKFEFIINLKAAKQIALTIPPNVLARADKVIK